MALPALAQDVSPQTPQTAIIVVEDDFLEFAAISMADGDYHNALYHANKALDLKPNSATAYLLRGQAYRQLGDREAAIADLGRAATLYLENNNLAGHQTALDNLSGVL